MRMRQDHQLDIAPRYPAYCRFYNAGRQRVRLCVYTDIVLTFHMASKQCSSFAWLGAGAKTPIAQRLSKKVPTTAAQQRQELQVAFTAEAAPPWEWHNAPAHAVYYGNTSDRCPHTSRDRLR